MAKEPIYKGKDKHGKSVWEIQVSTGTKVGGKYQRVTETFHGTKADAKKRQREIETDVDGGINVKGGKTPFDGYAKQWLGEKRVNLAPRTIVGYELSVDRLCELLGNTPLERIDAPTVRKVVAGLRGMIKGRDGKPSESTVKASYTVLSGILKQAERDDLIRRNPCTKVDPPKATSKERRSMSASQYTTLLKAIEDSTAEEYAKYAKKENHLKETGHQNKERHAIRCMHVPAYLAAVRIIHATGMRPSEVFALQWKHVDFANGCIHVEQATELPSGGVKETKSHAGKRDIYLNAPTLQYLSAWRAFQAQAANKLGLELGLSTWVVCSDAFTQVHSSNFNKWWNTWSEAHGFGGWEVYELRHTQVTLLLDAHADIKTVQTRLGHSSAAVTLGVYAHALESSQRAAADLLPTLA